MREKLTCNRCGARFMADSVDDALEAEELICPVCGYLFKKGDLGRRDWLHKPVDPFKFRVLCFLAIIVIATAIGAPVVAAAMALAILAGALCAYLIRAFGKSDEPPNIISRKGRE